MKCILCGEDFPTVFYFVDQNRNFPCVNCQQNNLITDEILLQKGIKEEFDIYLAKAKILKKDKTNLRLKINSSHIIAYSLMTLIIFLVWLPFFIWAEFFVEYKQYFILLNILIITVGSSVINPIIRFSNFYNSYKTIIELSKHDFQFSKYIQRFNQLTFSKNDITKFADYLKSQKILNYILKLDKVEFALGLNIYNFIDFLKPKFDKIDKFEFYYDGKIDVISSNDKYSSGLINFFKILYVGYLDNDKTLFEDIRLGRKDLIVNRL